VIVIWGSPTCGIELLACTEQKSHSSRQMAACNPTGRGNMLSISQLFVLQVAFGALQGTPNAVCFNVRTDLPVRHNAILMIEFEIVEELNYLGIVLPLCKCCWMA
jgi:hypothetical protein